MPEVFHNHYSFPADSVPAAEAFRDQLAAQFNQPLELEKQEQGFKGAPRAYAQLRNDHMQIWIYWERDRPGIEVVVDEPIERMIPINAAITSLGGNPQYPDSSWKARRRDRVGAKVIHLLSFAVAIIMAAALIRYSGWWGVLGVIGVTAVGTLLWMVALARSFRR